MKSKVTGSGPLPSLPLKGPYGLRDMASYTKGKHSMRFGGEMYLEKIIHDTRSDLFVRNLIRQTLSYTTGRVMEPADNFAIDEILETVKKEKLGLRTLLVECLVNRVFRSRYLPAGLVSPQALEEQLPDPLTAPLPGGIDVSAIDCRYRFQGLEELVGPEGLEPPTKGL